MKRRRSIAPLALAMIFAGELSRAGAPAPLQVGGRTAVRAARTAGARATAGGARGDLRARGARVALPPAQLRAALTGGRSETVSGLVAQLRELEAVQGDRDGVLQPRDLTAADPDTAAVMERVYAQLGRKSLPLARIEAALPGAVADLVAAEKRRGATGALYAGAVADAVRHLAARYREDVLETRRLTPSAFVGARALGRVWGELRRTFPSEFAAPEGPGDRDALAALYQRFVAGELTGKAFLRRAGLSSENLARLQAEDPERFPVVDADAGARIGQAARTVLDLARARALARLWKARVTSRLQTIAAFLEENNLSVGQLRRLRADHPDAFVSPEDAHVAPGRRRYDEAFVEAVAARTRAALEDDVLLDIADVVARMNADEAFVRAHGRVTEQEYLIMSRNHRRLFPDLKDARWRFEVLAREARALLAADPALTARGLVAKMTARHPHFTPSRLVRLRAFHPDIVPAREAPTGAENGGGLKSAAQSAPVLALARLAVELAPPGTAVETLGASVNRLLAARGLPEVSANHAVFGLAEKEGFSVAAHGAQVASEVVAEYARAMPRATRAEVLAAVQRDYPTLAGRALTAYQAEWAKAPKAYPALAALAPGAAARLGKVDPPRYLGGWDVERAVLADSARAAELARRADLARIPTRLPLLDRVIDRLGGKTPLESTNVLWVTHLFGSTHTMGAALRRAGLSTRQAVVVGSPYGSNAAVKAAMEADGFDVRVPRLSPEGYQDAVRAAVADLVAKHRANRKPMVVIDDGGQVAEILASTPAYADVLGKIKIVEQTTRGITNAERLGLPVTTINVARSASKAYEARFIGRVVTAKLGQALARTGQALGGRRVAVLGYGFIGEEIARSLRAQGAEVVVVEPGQARAQAARRARLRVADKAEALASADVVIGATGVRSLELADLERLKDGAVVLSASSKQVEIDMAALGRAAVRTPLRSTSRAHLPNATYRLGRARLTVLGDGWPINFDGSVEGVPHEEIQLTLAALLEGALQASTIATHDGTRKKIIPLDPRRDQALLSAYKREEARRRGARAPISDPDAWREGLLALAADAAGPERAAPPAGEPPEAQLARRAALGDRALALALARGLPEGQGVGGLREAAARVLGAPLSWEALNQLRDRNPDLLGHLVSKRKIQLSPAQLARAEALRKQGLSHADVAAKLGVSKNTLWRALKGLAL